MERLYDFEEECVEGYFREQEVFLHQSTEERIKSTTERVENMSQKIEDINQKENVQSVTVQAIDIRLRKMEESAEQILSHLAVIHRFMSTHTSVNSDHIQGSIGNVNELRVRSISENEPSGGPSLPMRRRYNRSYTEGQPDMNPFEDLTSYIHSEVPEETEMIRSKESLNAPIVRIPSVKVSAQSIESEVFERDFGGIPLSRQTSLPKREASTESKDTITPVENSDAHTLVGDDPGEEDNVDQGFPIDGELYQIN